MFGSLENSTGLDLHLFMAMSWLADRLLMPGLVGIFETKCQGVCLGYSLS